MVEAVVAVPPQITQVTGLLHGGLYAAMAESMATLGTNSRVNSDGQIALGALSQSRMTIALRAAEAGRPRQAR